MSSSQSVEDAAQFLSFLARKASLHMLFTMLNCSFNTLKVTLAATEKREVSLALVNICRHLNSGAAILKQLFGRRAPLNSSNDCSRVLNYSTTRPT